MVTTDNIFQELEVTYVIPSTNVLKPYFCSLQVFGLENGKYDILSGAFPVVLLQSIALQLGIPAHCKLNFPTYTKNVKDKNTKKEPRTRKSFF